jgi:hypothetical protein
MLKNYKEQKDMKERHRRNRKNVKGANQVFIKQTLDSWNPWTLFSNQIGEELKVLNFNQLSYFCSKRRA